jgi:hypothetical protein
VVADEEYRGDIGEWLSLNMHFSLEKRMEEKTQRFPDPFLTQIWLHTGFKTFPDGSDSVNSPILYHVLYNQESEFVNFHSKYHIWKHGKNGQNASVRFRESKETCLQECGCITVKEEDGLGMGPENGSLHLRRDREFDTKRQRSSLES